LPIRRLRHFSARTTWQKTSLFPANHPHECRQAEPAVEQRHAALALSLIDAEDQVFAVSPLVKMECLVKPLKSGNVLLKKYYDDLFQTLVILDVNEAVFLAAADYAHDFRSGPVTLCIWRAHYTTDATRFGPRTGDLNMRAVVSPYPYWRSKGKSSLRNCLVGHRNADHSLAIVTRNAKDFDVFGVTVLNPFDSQHDLGLALYSLGNSPNGLVTKPPVSAPPILMFRRSVTLSSVCIRIADASAKNL